MIHADAFEEISNDVIDYDIPMCKIFPDLNPYLSTTHLLRDVGPRPIATLFRRGSMTTRRRQNSGARKISAIDL